MSFPNSGNTYVPNFEPLPDPKAPPPSDKRYAVMIQGEVLLDTDEFREAFLLISAGHATSVYDRGVVRVNRYCKMTPVIPPTEEK